MNMRSEPRMEKVQFFDWLAHQEHKYELANGRVLLLPFVTRNHALICTNVVLALADRLDRAAFEIVQGDFAVETGDQSVRFADVMVEAAGGAGSERSTKRALFLVEVLSPSTMHVDFGEKLREYSALPQLGTYLILAQDEARAWVWGKSEGVWPDAPLVIEGGEATVDIAVLGASLPLSELYRNLPLR